MTSPRTNVSNLVMQFELFMGVEHQMRCKGRIKPSALDINTRFSVLISGSMRLIARKIMFDTHVRVGHHVVTDSKI